jgi:hypothetical protein
MAALFAAKPKEGIYKMSFKSGAQGINKKGKTKGKQLGIDGAKVPIEKGPKHSGSKGGKSNMEMKTMGRGMAKVAAQKKG